jgi:CheY-like chemotaxis protein
MKLLLVDDDASERTVLRDLLRTLGTWEIVEAGTAREAFQLLCDGLNPEVSFFDLRMPEIDGMQLLTMVRQEPTLRQAKIIMTSSSRDRDTILAMTKLGVTGYLLKPYELAKSSASLRQIFGAARVTIPALAQRNLLHRTVLVVDDDEIMRLMFRNLLSSEDGWDVEEAADGLEALEKLRGGLRPELGIFDLKMPKLDGQTLLSRIREDPNLRRMPVVIVSGQQDRAKILSLAQLRISGYLLKPLDLAKASAVIQQAIKTPAA